MINSWPTHERWAESLLTIHLGVNADPDDTPKRKNRCAHGICHGLWFGRSGGLTVDKIFDPGFAICGRLEEASLQVRPLRERSAECRLPGACVEGPRRKSLTTTET